MSVAQRWRGRLFSWLGSAPSAWPSDLGLDLQALPLAAVRLDIWGRIQGVNAGWTHLIKQPSASCLGREYRSFLHPEDQPLWDGLLNGLSAAPGPSDTQILRHLSGDGGLCWVEVRLAMESGGGSVAFLIDITEQRREQRALQASHRSLVRLVDDLPMMVYRCRNNRLWSMEYVSAGCFQLTGYHAEQLIDSHEFSYNNLIHPQDREWVWTAVQKALAETRSFTLDYRLLRADGRELHVQEHGCGIHAGSGEVLGLEGVVIARSAPESFAGAVGTSDCEQSH